MTSLCVWLDSALDSIVSGDDVCGASIRSAKEKIMQGLQPDGGSTSPFLPLIDIANTLSTGNDFSTILPLESPTCARVADLSHTKLVIDVMCCIPHGAFEQHGANRT
jgi:hypothetical protein